ncbi:ABC transporter ATP-binding protein [Timonella senegalensis]|uniref:ABC transporter ATP-binding protein n=1 Tax=Timonella senegalensis TaxID=1465825 RepID=UPI0028ADC22D|nr:ABC transporter ATP-binding protein [Timonella senegalensis]
MSQNTPAHEEIRFSHLTKRFGTLTAVNDLSFTVTPGRVTGFLGPNGSGKTTTLRMLLGLSKPTAGTATFGNTRYADLKHPSRTVGAALDASSFHPGRTARDHLRAYAPLAGASDAWIAELLALVGLSSAATKRVGEFSLGMAQRLALASALLGDPEYLVLDEPANGLDPQGIRWLREFLRHLAASGKTVLVSSHILSEVQQSVDDVVIIAEGTLRFAAPIAELHQFARPRVRLRSPQVTAAAELAARSGWQVTQEDGAFVIYDESLTSVGTAAFAAGLEIHELADLTEPLEESFLRLTAPSDKNASEADAVGPEGTAAQSGDPHGPTHTTEARA